MCADKTITEVAPGIYHLPVPLANSPMTDLDHMNVYLIQGTRGWLLVDAAWNAPETFRFIENSLKSLNLTFTDIETIFITHSHPDHYGLAGKLKALSPKTRLLMHQWEAHVIESRYVKFLENEKKADALLGSHGIPAAELDLTKAGIPSPAELVAVAMPDGLLYGGEVIRTGKYDLEVIWAPGHSPGLVCLYEPKNQFLFAGDHLLPTITPNVSYNVYSGDNPLGDYLYSLGKVANLPVRHVFPGHEEPFTTFQERVASIKEHHRLREAEIYKVITKQPVSANEIASQLKWNMRGLKWQQFHPLHKRMATSEVIAHLEHLRWSGKIRRIFEKDHIFYGTV